MVLVRVPSPVVISEKELAEYAFKELRWLDRLRRRKILQYTAPYLGRRARVIILDVKSDRELFDILNSEPLHNYSEKEVIPLTTEKSFEEVYRKRYGAARAAKRHKLVAGNLVG